MEGLDPVLLNKVKHLLENNGVLQGIKAQLRASVYQAIDKHEESETCKNGHLTELLSTDQGRIALSLVLDMLEHCQLIRTKSVFDVEVQSPDLLYERIPLASRLGTSTSAQPILTDLIKDLDGRKKEKKYQLSEMQIKNAREKFILYDQKGDGMISTDDLCFAFGDILPHFSRGMLERFIQEESRILDRKANSRVDFNYFLELYRRLFSQCLDVVGSGEVGVGVGESRVETDLRSTPSDRPKTSRGAVLHVHESEQLHTRPRQQSPTGSLIPRLRSPTQKTFPSGPTAQILGSDPVKTSTTATNGPELSHKTSTGIIRPNYMKSKEKSAPAASSLLVNDKRLRNTTDAPKDHTHKEAANKLDEDWLTTDSIFDDMTFNSEFTLDADYIEDFEFPPAK